VSEFVGGVTPERRIVCHSIAKIFCWQIRLRASQLEVYLNVSATSRVENAHDSGLILGETIVGNSDGLREPCGLNYQQLGRLSDEHIMAHLVAGHGDAMAVLLDRYVRLVTSIAYKIIHDQPESEDVAQEVFVDLCRTAAQFDAAKGTAKMWIIRTAYRRSLTRRRNSKIRDLHFQGGLDEVLQISNGCESSMGLKLSSCESQRLVRQTLGKLNGTHRIILEMVFFEGLTLLDVASKTGATIESVRHRYYRGINKLRQLIIEQRPDKSIAKQETLDARA
jgi:RNA polymerase sigma-70 factor (ECF subfamily)